jgi:hypothetical protein
MPTLKNNENIGLAVQDDASSCMNESGTGWEIDTPLTQVRSPRVPGYVYFLRAGDAIKIGFSIEPNQRKSGLQVGNPVELETLATVSVNKITEREAKDKFNHLKIRGEWFRAEPELLDFIAGFARRRPAPQPPDDVPLDPHKFKQWADAQCPRWPVPLMIEAAHAWDALAYRGTAEKIDEFSKNYAAWRK